MGRKESGVKREGGVGIKAGGGGGGGRRPFSVCFPSRLVFALPHWGACSQAQLHATRRVTLLFEFPTSSNRNNAKDNQNYYNQDSQQE